MECTSPRPHLDMSLGNTDASRVCASQMLQLAYSQQGGNLDWKKTPLSIGVQKYKKRWKILYCHNNCWGSDLFHKERRMERREKNKYTQNFMSKKLLHKIYCNIYITLTLLRPETTSKPVIKASIRL